MEQHRLAPLITQAKRLPVQCLHLEVGGHLANLRRLQRRPLRLLKPDVLQAGQTCLEFGQRLLCHGPRAKSE